MEEDWNTIRAFLLSDKVTKRKEGLKKVDILLDSDKALVMKALDQSTLQIWLDEDVPAFSWPGMASDLTKFVTLEIEDCVNKNKAPVRNLGKIMRKFVGLAEDKTRSGRRLMLVRRSRRLFEHISRTLDAVDPASQIAADYNTILRLHLLPVVEYCAEAASVTFEELMDGQLNAIESLPLGKPDESYGAFLVINLLISNFPGDIPQFLQKDLMLFFTKQVRQMHSIRDAPKVGVGLLKCINSFLSEYGLNHLGQMSKLHIGVHPFLKANWTSIHNMDLKEHLVTYMRLQLQLGGIQGAQNILSELFEVCEKDLLQSNRQWQESWDTFHWGKKSDASGWKLKKTQNAYAELMGSLTFHMWERGKGQSGEDGDGEEGRQKRQKLLSLQDRILHDFKSNPLLWGPILCALLQHHADYLPDAFMDDCLSTLVDGTTQCATSLNEDYQAKAAGGAIWVLRVAQVLAVQWRTECKGSNKIQDRWRRIESAIHKFPTIDRALQNESYLLLGTIFRLCLLPVKGIAELAYYQQAIKSPPLQSGALCLLPAVALDASHKSHNYKLYIDCCLIRDPSNLEHDAAINALAVLLGRAEEVHYYHCLWVLWDAESIKFEAHLRNLKHGRNKFQSMVRKLHTVDARASLEGIRSNHAWAVQQIGIHKLLELMDSSSFQNPDQFKRRLWMCTISVQFLLLSRTSQRSDIAQGLINQLKGAVGNELKMLGQEIFSSLDFWHQELKSIVAAIQFLISSVVCYDSCEDNKLSHNLSNLNNQLVRFFLNHYNGTSIDGGSLRMATSINEYDLFDRGTDMVITRKGSSQGSTGSSPLEVKSGIFIACLQLLGSLSRCFQDGNWGCLQSIIQHVNQFEAAPPYNIHCALIEAGCMVGAVGKGEALQEACNALCDLIELTPPKLFQGSRFTFILLQLSAILSEVSKSAEPKTHMMRISSTSPWGDSLDTLCETNLCIEDDVWEVVSGPFVKLISVAKEALELDGSCLKSASLLQLARLTMMFALQDPHEYRSMVESQILALIKDPHPAFCVRQGSIPLVCDYLSGWDGSRSFFHNLKLAILQDPPTPGVADDEADAVQMVDPQIETEIEFLVGCGVACSKLEGDCLFMMCVHASLYPSNLKLVQDALEVMAVSLHYPSRREYLLFHQTELVAKWFADGRTLDQFLTMRHLLYSNDETKVDEARFMADVKEAIITSLVLNSQEDALKGVSQLLGQPIERLLEESLPSIVAAMRLRSLDGNYSDEKSMGCASPGRLLSKYVSEEEVERCGEEERVKIVQALLLMSMDDSDSVGSNRASYPVGWIVQSIKSCNGGGGGHSQLYGMQVCWLLLVIHKWLNRSMHPLHKTRPLAAIESLVEALGNRVCDDAVFRYIIHLLLLHIGIPELQERVCALLGLVLGKKIEIGKEIPAHFLAVKGCFRKVASTITECVENPDTISSLRPAVLINRKHERTSEENRRSHLLIGVLEFLVDQPNLRPVVHEVDPFPDTEEFSRLREVQKGEREGTVFLRQLALFIKRAGSMTRAMQERAVLHLRHLLDANRKEIHQMACERALPEGLVHQAWKLVQMTSEVEFDGLWTLCGELLGLLGPFEPYKLTMKATHFSRVQKLSRPIAEVLDGRRSQSVATLDPIMPTILYHFSEALLDKNVEIVECAQKTLCRMLASEYGRTSLRKVKAGQALSQYLEVYVNQVVRLDCDMDEPWIARSSTYPIQNDELWLLASACYEEWVCRIACVLLESVENPNLKLLQGMASLSGSFAELLMPYILQDLALGTLDQRSLKQILSEQVQEFVLLNAENAQRALQLVLLCFEFLRQCHRDWVACTVGAMHYSRFVREPPSKWRKVYWLDIDYQITSIAAYKGSAFFTALVYIEHWCENTNNGLILPETSGDDCDQNDLSLMDGLLLDICRNVGYVDGLGAATKSPNMLCQLTLNEQKRNWEHLVTVHDVALSQSSSLQPYSGLVNALRSLGWSSILKSTLNSLKSTPSWQEEFSDIEAELAWRMGEWDCSHSSSSVEEPGVNSCFNAAFHHALRDLRDGDCRGFLLNARTCRHDTVKSLSSSATESLATVNSALVRLQMVDMMAEGWHAKWSGLDGMVEEESNEASSELGILAKMDSHELLGGAPNLVSESIMDALEHGWESREELAGLEGRFELMEPLLALHGVLLKCLGQQDRLPKVLLNTAKNARRAGHLPAARQALERLRHIISGNQGMGNTWIEKSDAAWMQEEAKLLWVCGEKQMAVQLGRSILQKLKDKGSGCDTEMLAQWLCKLGGWLAETKLEPSSAVMKIMMEAAQVVEEAATNGCGANCGAVGCKVMYKLANFAGARYEAIQKQKSSQEWLTSKAVVENKREQMQILESSLKTATSQEMKKELTAMIEKLRRPIEVDEQEVRALEEEEAKLLKIAIQNFRKCLLAGDIYDLPAVFRLCQLWFKLGFDEGVNAEIRKAFREVASCKFIPLVYQIASRMSAATGGPLVESGFHSSLNELITRIAVDHPYHVLYQIFALSNGNLANKNRPGGKPSSKVMVRNVDMDKVSAAQQILANLSSRPKTKDIVSEMSFLINAYLKLAAATSPTIKAPSSAFPPDIQLNVRGLKLIPIVSKRLEVQRDGRYQFKHFEKFGNKMWYVGGLNKPKLIACMDSVGTRYKELVKSGSDDLRQDAVMQQFFELVNSLLSSWSETRKRNLSITTYKVVPFTAGVGMLEWVEHTIPMSDYLLGPDKRGGAHERYRSPSELTFVECHQRMNASTGRRDARRRFDTVCRQFQPVLHHFFLENYPNPSTWFERRLAYTKSTAVNSMAGYIIGLGDRHASNILLRKSTGDAIHIDLGIAFEQGRFLNIPELVPFRLTRDIVNGMGVNGVEGSMRRCCEETITVLRQNREALLTIIEVFIHDPLYNWAMSPTKALNRQRDDVTPAMESGSSSILGYQILPTIVNADAERALLRVRRKLEGNEDGETRGVQGHVQQLIQDAQDPDNLAAMFVGWAPWL